MAIEHFNKRIICFSNFFKVNSDFSFLNVNSFWFSFLCDSELNVMGSGQGKFICTIHTQGNSKPKCGLQGHKDYIKRNLKKDILLRNRTLQQVKTYKSRLK